MVFPINTPNKASFILIFKIEARAAPLHDPVVGSGTPTNTISPKILYAFNFFAPLSIFASTHLITMLKYFLCLK